MYIFRNLMTHHKHNDQMEGNSSALIAGEGSLEAYVPLLPLLLVIRDIMYKPDIRWHFTVT